MYRLAFVLFVGCISGPLRAADIEIEGLILSTAHSAWGRAFSDSYSHKVGEYEFNFVVTISEQFRQNRSSLIKVEADRKLIYITMIKKPQDVQIAVDQALQATAKHITSLAIPEFNEDLVGDGYL